MYKFYICAAIFILLSAAKFFLPQHSEKLREQVISIIDTDDDYPQMLEVLGRRISQEGLGEEIMRVLNIDSRELKAVSKEILPESVEVFLESK